MVGEVQTLVKVLNLEIKNNYQDKAVTGGFKNFRAFIEKLSQDSGLSPDVLEEIGDSFKKYEDLKREEREQIVFNLLGLLNSQIASKITNTDSSLNSGTIHKQQKDSTLLSNQDPALYAGIQSISGIGQKNSRLFNKLDINTVYQLLRYYPRRYQDFSQLKPINKLELGDELTIIGTLSQGIQSRKSKNNRLTISTTNITDRTGTLRVIWFNQPFLAKLLHQGVSIVISGKIDVYLGRLVMNNPEWELLDVEQLHTNRIVPIYPLTAGLTQRQMRKIINRNLNFWTKRVKEYLPDQIIIEEELIPISEAIAEIHFPKNEDRLTLAKKRFAFEEIFFLQLGVFFQKRDWIKESAIKIPLASDDLSRVTASLPYELTRAQLNAISEISVDLESGSPMNRLLQGDVGSGKTVVARIAIEAIIQNGFQTAMLAPTSILAEQHFNTLSNLLISAESANQNEVALLTGSTSKKERFTILDKLADGSIKVIVGTHAILEDTVVFNNLQLAIIDEQHRFGVEQRNLLKKKGKTPHLLVMTATPIPRSLALTIYGDLDVSVIDEMPLGRLPVQTQLLAPRDREQAYSMIRSQIISGFQAFIVYPMIDDAEEEEFTAVVNEHERLSRKVFPDLKIGLLHGKLRPVEKNNVMESFRNRELDILVSTTVIEVGMDIPNATIVLIEGANHFGLAQLHQIRGRVGRNSEKSCCLLIPDNDSDIENERLNAMVKTNDGFILADFDLKQRGPGEFLGTRQSGYVPLRFANITDISMIERCRNHAQRIFNSDPGFIKQEYNLLYHELSLHWPQININ